MPSDPPKRESSSPHRPLPSIDVPLLREERVALRTRRMGQLAVLGALIAAVVGAGVGLVGLGGSSDTEPANGAADDLPLAEPLTAAGPALTDAGRDGTAEAALALPSENKPRFTQQPFGKTGGFRNAVENAGLSRDESLAVIASLEGVLDFRRCQPDHELTVERDASGALQRFGYRASLTQRYESLPGADGALSGRQVEVPIRKVRIAKGGVVTGSLGDALEGLSLQRSLAGVFVEVFEGRIRFATDTRSGDSFRVIVDEEYVDDTFLGYGSVHAIEYRGQRSGKQRAYWHQHKDSEGDFYDSKGRALHGGWLRTPVRYDHISSPFGSRFHPVLKRRMPHNGVDYAAASGTPVRAAAHGEVTFAAPKGANGNLIALKHANRYETLYAHLLRFGRGIKKGAKVRQRQIIGYVGSTGRSTGPHLHFALKQRGRFKDPVPQLNGVGLPMPRAQLGAYRKRVQALDSALNRITLQTPAPVEPSAPAVPRIEPVDGL